MKKELEVFQKMSWKSKFEYIIKFYQGMIKKTDNPQYIIKFQGKIDEVKSYEENELNNNKLISIFESIMGAKESTKQRKFEETKKTIQNNKQKLACIESSLYEQDPDEYLTESMAQL